MTITISLFTPVFKCSVNIKHFAAYKIRGVYDDS